jgi:hypothetical protein
MRKVGTMSPARWFVVPYFVLAHFIGGIFAFPLALMFLNYAVKCQREQGSPIGTLLQRTASK